MSLHIHIKSSLLKRDKHHSNKIRLQCNVGGCALRNSTTYIYIYIYIYTFKFRLHAYVYK